MSAKNFEGPEINLKKLGPNHAVSDRSTFTGHEAFAFYPGEFTDVVVTAPIEHEWLNTETFYVLSTQPGSGEAKILKNGRDFTSYFAPVSLAATPQGLLICDGKGNLWWNDDKIASQCCFADDVAVSPEGSVFVLSTKGQVWRDGQLIDKGGNKYKAPARLLATSTDEYWIMNAAGVVYCNGKKQIEQGPFMRCSPLMATHEKASLSSSFGVDIPFPSELNKRITPLSLLAEQQERQQQQLQQQQQQVVVVGKGVHAAAGLKAANREKDKREAAAAAMSNNKEGKPAQTEIYVLAGNGVLFRNGVRTTDHRFVLHEEEKISQQQPDAAKAERPTSARPGSEVGRGGGGEGKAAEGIEDMVLCETRIAGAYCCAAYVLTSAGNLLRNGQRILTLPSLTTAASASPLAAASTQHVSRRIFATHSGTGTSVPAASSAVLSTSSTSSTMPPLVVGVDPWAAVFSSTTLRNRWGPAAFAGTGGGPTTSTTAEKKEKKQQPVEQDGEEEMEEDRTFLSLMNVHGQRGGEEAVGERGGKKPKSNTGRGKPPLASLTKNKVPPTTTTTTGFSTSKTSNTTKVVDREPEVILTQKLRNVGYTAMDIEISEASIVRPQSAMRRTQENLMTFDDDDDDEMNGGRYVDSEEEEDNEAEKEEEEERRKNLAVARGVNKKLSASSPPLAAVPASAASTMKIEIADPKQTGNNEAVVNEEDIDWDKMVGDLASGEEEEGGGEEEEQV